MNDKYCSFLFPLGLVPTIVYENNDEIPDGCTNAIPFISGKTFRNKKCLEF